MDEPKKPFHEFFAHFESSSDLREISALLDVVFTWRNGLRAEIADAEQSWRLASSMYAEMAAEASALDLYHQSVFRDAAAVQAAVGTLAPFIEGFLAHAFDYLLYLSDRLESGDGSRDWGDRARLVGIPDWPQADQQAPFIACVKKMTQALALEEWLDKNLLDRLELLFTFRNRSLHNAYRWPKATIARFKKCVDQRGWQPWVQWAMCGEQPWMAYLTDEFISDQLSLTRRLTDGFRSVVRARGGNYRGNAHGIEDLI